MVLSKALSPEQKTFVLAETLHQEWRQTRLQPDGTYEPRLKETHDTQWIAEHSTNKVDIANTEYGSLPEDWKKENKEAAEFIVKEFVNTNHIIDFNNKKSVEEVGDKIHSAWLQRNKWAVNSELDVPFFTLPPAEQEKDLEQYRLALNIFFR